MKAFDNSKFKVKNMHIFYLLKNKIYITAVAFCLAAALLISFFIWPLYIGIKNDSKKLISRRNEAAILQAQSIEVENFKKIYYTYKPNLEKIGQLFIDQKNPAEFIKFLETTAADSGLKVKISLTASSAKEKNDFITFQLFCNDDFLKIMRFSEKLEHGPYLIDIKSFSAKNSGESAISKNNGSGKVDANFSINAFTKKEL